MDDVTVVMYHYVRNIRNSRYPGIKGLEYTDFLEQLRFIKKNYNPISIEQLNYSFEKKNSLPENPVLLTFDDAYIDHFKYVYPALKKIGLQGSFYAPVKAVTERCVLDVNKIHFILSSGDDIKELIKELAFWYDTLKDQYKVEEFESLYKRIARSNRFDSAEVIFFKRSLQVELPEPMRNLITDRLFEKFVGMSEEAFSEELYMNRFHLEHLVKDGMHVGSHGYDHYWWNKLPKEQRGYEIDASVDFLNSIGAANKLLSACYPYGSWSYPVVKELANKGFSIAFTTETDLGNPLSSDRLLIPRLDTNDIPKYEFSEINCWHPDFKK